MSWTIVKRWLTAIPERNAVNELLSSSAKAPTNPGGADHGRNDGSVDAPKVLNVRAPRGNDSERTHQRKRVWRRRALLRKGARLYSSIPWKSSFVSFAMLDEDGVVIGWYERGNDPDAVQRRPMESHVSQLYTASDVGLGVPVRDLCNATLHGECVQTGWRVGLDGKKFWATTTIRAVSQRDGRLQGFSHLTHRVPTPWRREGATSLWPWKWPMRNARTRELSRRGSESTTD